MQIRTHVNVRLNLMFHCLQTHIGVLLQRELVKKKNKKTMKFLLEFLIYEFDTHINYDDRYRTRITSIDKIV